MASHSEASGASKATFDVTQSSSSQHTAHSEMGTPDRPIRVDSGTEPSQLLNGAATGALAGLSGPSRDVGDILSTNQLQIDMGQSDGYVTPSQVQIGQFQYGSTSSGQQLTPLVPLPARDATTDSEMRDQDFSVSSRSWIMTQQDYVAPTSTSTVEIPQSSIYQNPPVFDSSLMIEDQNDGSRKSRAVARRPPPGNGYASESGSQFTSDDYLRPVRYDSSRIVPSVGPSPDFCRADQFSMASSRHTPKAGSRTNSKRSGSSSSSVRDKVHKHSDKRERKDGSSDRKSRSSRSSKYEERERRRETHKQST